MHRAARNPRLKVAIAVYENLRARGIDREQAVHRAMEWVTLEDAAKEMIAQRPNWTNPLRTPLKSERTRITSWSWKMFTKIAIVLAAGLLLGVASEALARGAGGVTPCNLAGFNPVFHGAIFGKMHPDVAKAYGFVKLSGEGKHGTWGLDPNVCGHT
jgi:hypothetical protein